MTEESNPVPDITQEAVEALLQRAIRNTLILGLIPAAVVLFASAWRDAAMLATGTFISAASIFEWLRLTRVIYAKLNNQKTPRSAPAVVVFFVLRLTVYAGVIYGSLKCFQGSVIALLCGLGLAALAVGWEAVRLLRD
ncbi:MAG: hypothetical protein P4L26_01810 [Terracidiphilus sp.]|nr:hypothetical protein [Terracidiphilus sp.]